MAYIGLTFMAAIVYNLVLFVLSSVNMGAAELLVIPVVQLLPRLLWIIAQRMINTGVVVRCHARSDSEHPCVSSLCHCQEAMLTIVHWTPPGRLSPVSFSQCSG